MSGILHTYCPIVLVGGMSTDSKKCVNLTSWYKGSTPTFIIFFIFLKDNDFETRAYMRPSYFPVNHAVA